MEYVIMIGQLMLSLSFLIILHEMGHFFPARLFGTRVEKFYLFFDAGFSLFKYKKGETEYGIGWLPLGGYVKISGMIDESFDTEQMEQEPQEWEFRSKPAWQRLIIMLGGVTVNFILGFFIFAMIYWAYGEEYLPAKNAEFGIHADSLGVDMGLQNGDDIISIGGQPFERFSDRELVRAIVIDGVDEMTIERAGAQFKLPIDEKYVKILSSSENKGARVFVPRVPFVIGNLLKDDPAEKAGLEVNDSIMALNGQPIQFFDQFLERVKKIPNEEILVTVMKENGQTKEVTLTTTERGTIGVQPFGAGRYFELDKIDYTLAEALPAGTIRGWTFLSDQVKAFGRIFTGDIAAKDSLGGFASIGTMFGTEWNWERFWTMTAILSLILAFMNLLPIPALDGGHVMFLLYELVSGRKPSDKFMEYATMVGFVLIIALMLYANGLDVVRGCN